MEAKTREQRRRSPSPADRKYRKSPRNSISGQRKTEESVRFKGSKIEPKPPLQQPEKIARTLIAEILYAITQERSIIRGKTITAKFKEPQ
eukprot:1735681-Amphidinium_carterae.1